MRTLLISAAATIGILGIAAPAQAQYYQGQPYGYDQGYGYQNDWRAVRYLQSRVDNVQRQIVQLDRRNILSRREANRLRVQSRNIEFRLRASARNGLHPRERYSIERQIANLEQRVWREANDRDRRYGRGYDNRDDPRWGAYRDRNRGEYERDYRRDRDED